MTTKKYCYDFTDIGVKIYADNGDECMRKFIETTGKSCEEYHGIVDLLDAQTGNLINRMYPIIVH